MADQEKAFDASDHLIKLRGGKDYLPVAWRLYWLRDKHPEAIIVTELLDRTDTFALFKADITIPYGGQAVEGVDMTGGGSATGHGSETAEDFGDFIEKAETKAIGRALAALGYGTQFCADELDELDGKRGERIVDSPVQRTQPRQAAPKRAAAPPIGAYESAHESARERQAQKEIERSSKEQHGFIRSLLARMFPDDDQAQVGCIASINEHAVNDAATEIHLIPLSKGEASAMISELQKMQQAEPEPKLAAVGADPGPEAPGVRQRQKSGQFYLGSATAPSR